MKIIQFTILIFLMIAYSCSSKLTGLTKIKGDVVPIQKKTIIVFLSLKCEENLLLVDALSEINMLYNNKYNLALVVNSKDHTLNDMHQFINNHELHFWKAYFDTDNKFALLNKVKKAPQIFVVDKDANVLYQGIASNVSTNMKEGEPIVNFLSNAVNAIEKGNKANPAITVGKGCNIE